MYKIGEFSQMTNLTVKTLRYYDDANILSPSFRDETNGYRLYNEDDYRRAELVILLRKFDFSISEIKDVLINYESRSDLPYYLAEKKNMIMKQIEHDQNLVRSIDTYLAKPKVEETKHYKVESKTYDSALAATVRYQGKYEDCGKYFAALYETAGTKIVGIPFCRYYDTEFKEDGADIEVCIPVKESVTGEGIEIKRLPAIEVIATTHTGPYFLGPAYKALTDYAMQNKIQWKAPWRETFLKGPGLLFKGNPNRYVTEVAFEIEL